MVALGNTLVVIKDDGSVFGAEVTGQNIGPVFQFPGQRSASTSRTGSWWRWAEHSAPHAGLAGFGDWRAQVLGDFPQMAGAGLLPGAVASQLTDRNPPLSAPPRPPGPRRPRRPRPAQTPATAARTASATPVTCSVGHCGDRAPAGRRQGPPGSSQSPGLSARSAAKRSAEECC